MATPKYSCENCKFHTNVRQNYTYHMKSKRHAENIDNDKLFSHVCAICNKKYKSMGGLMKHNSKCIAIPIAGNNIAIEEIKNILLDIKASQKPTPPNIINNQNNNVNIILNEKCNAAKNFIDMVNNIQLLSVYPPTITSEDYVKTIVGMLKTAIDQYPITERPIQCIKDEDENQKIIHIRHLDAWHKEKEIDWTTQIHNSSLGDDDAPAESEEKIIFHAIKNMEKHLLNKIGLLYGREAQRDYSYEVGHPSNKIRIIKYILEYINIDKEELMKIINETYVTPFNISNADPNGSASLNVIR